MDKKNDNNRKNDKNSRRNRILKIVFIWAGFLIMFFLAWQWFVSSHIAEQMTKDYSEVVDMVEANKVAKIQIYGNEVIGETRDGKLFRTFTPPEDPEFLKLLRERNVSVSVRPKSDGFPIWIYLLGPLIFIIFGIFMFRSIFRGLSGANNSAMQFGKSKAKLLSENKERVTFADVGGVKESKQDTEEVVDCLKNPARYTNVGAKIPKGMLLTGPPGTGKTLLARAIAGEAGVPFFSVAGSDFVEMFVGVGASRVRDLFNEGKKNAPCIIFIDEIDAVGRKRGSGQGNSHDEREQTLNQILIEMDGMEGNTGIIMVAATNRADILDPALTRPGRFDRKVFVPLPDVAGREEILNIHARGKMLHHEVNLSEIARATSGLAGADLANIINEAAILAVRKGNVLITMVELYDAIDRASIGVAREDANVLLSKEQLRIKSVHETGHATIFTLLSDADPMKKVTIIPHGQAGGVTQSVPAEDKSVYKRRELIARVMVFLGGRVAEEIYLDDITNGASMDIQYVTGLARAMISEWGMSEKIGPIALSGSESPFNTFSFYAREGEELRNEIDKEIKEMVKRAREKVREIIERNKAAVDVLIEVLLEKETVWADEVNEIFEKCGVDKPKSIKL